MTDLQQPITKMTITEVGFSPHSSAKTGGFIARHFGHLATTFTGGL